jgi:hypothetical protein
VGVNASVNTGFFSQENRGGRVFLHLKHKFVLGINILSFCNGKNIKMKNAKLNKYNSRTMPKIIIIQCN